jgi:ABC-type transport system involved in multi-copper enzyme maturation permease subunit
VRRTVTSELIKLRAIRSYAWLLGVATAFTAVLGPIQSLGQVLAGSSEPPGSAADAVSVALTGASTANLLLGVLGVLLVTGEYTSRAIRTTFTLVPQRHRVVLAKAIALALATVVTSVVAVALAVTVSFVILSQAGPYAGLHLGWGSPHVLHVAAAMVWYLVGWSLLGLAAGWLIRSKIGGVAVLIGFMYIVPPLVGLLPQSIGRVLVGLMPSSAGSAMLSVESGGGLGSPIAGFAIWTGYLVLFTALSGWVASRRDA